jgi:hypothetical protein
MGRSSRFVGRITIAVGSLFCSQAFADVLSITFSSSVPPDFSFTLPQVNPDLGLFGPFRIIQTASFTGSFTVTNNSGTFGSFDAFFTPVLFTTDSVGLSLRIVGITNPLFPGPVFVSGGAGPHSSATFLWRATGRDEVTVPNSSAYIGTGTVTFHQSTSPESLFVFQTPNVSTGVGFGPTSYSLTLIVPEPLLSFVIGGIFGLVTLASMRKRLGSPSRG